MKEKIAEIKALIAADELPEAFEQIKEILAKHKSYNDAILQEARFNEVRRLFDRGILDFKEISLTKNQVRTSLLELLSALEKVNLKQTTSQKIEGGILMTFGRFLIYGSILLFADILSSTFFDVSIFKIFNSDVSLEEIKSDLVGKTVQTSRDSIWIFLSLENFKEAEIISERKDGKYLEKTLNLKLLDISDNEVFHMKLFVRYEFAFFDWDIDLYQPLEYYKIE